MSQKRLKQQGKETHAPSSQDSASRWIGGVDPSDIQIMNELLKVAVPLHIFTLYERGGITRENLLRAQAEMEQVGESIDSFLNGHAKPGEPAAIFNRIARTIAVLSYMPGGVSAFNQHYEARAYLTGLLGEGETLSHWESAIQRCFGQEEPAPESHEGSEMPGQGR